MPTYSRTYTDAWVTKYTDSIVWKAKEIEGNSHVQQSLEELGATQDADGVYQMNSIPVKDQWGILVDFWAWRNHSAYTIATDTETARDQAVEEVQDDFENGGEA